MNMDRPIVALTPEGGAAALEQRVGLAWRPLFGSISAAAFWAGVTTFLWYAFGAVPVQLEIAGQLGLGAREAASAMFVIWFVGAVVSIGLSLHYRMPIPITWTLPGLIYLGTLGDRFTLPEIVGANLLAGIVIVLIGVLRVGERLMVWLPAPIVMGMFAGSILGYVNRMVSVCVEDMVVPGITLGAYLVGRMIADPRVPPMGLAVLAGGIAAVTVGGGTVGPLVWEPPVLIMPGIAFSAEAIVAIALPMVILTAGLGNVQGLGFLMAQGYRVPVTPVTVAVGLASMVNAVFGGHAATVARNGAAILAGSDAGPAESRYRASVVAAVLSVSIAFGAGTLIALLDALPSAYLVTLAACAILNALQDSLTTAFGGRLRFGALAALAVAATPFSILGISSAFWAVFAGLAASAMAERTDLLAAWRKAR